MNDVAERAIPLAHARIEGFEKAHGRKPTVREVVEMSVESVLDTQALDRLLAAMNEQEAMP